jgi:ribose transport system permease protein
VLARGGPLVGLVLVCSVFLVSVGPQFLGPANLELIARQTAIVCTAALGMTLVIVAAGIDLSVGSIVSLSTVVIALVLRQQGGPAAAALAGIAAGALCGVVTGLLVTRLKVVPFIVTLGMMLLVRGAAKGLAEERRLEAPITWLNDLLRTARSGLLPVGVWMTAALALLVAALLCGVRVERTQVFVYTLSAGLAGLAGVLQFSKLSVGDPTVAVGLELDVIAAVIIGGGSLSGGKGSALGTVLGATIMAVIQIGCSQRGLPNWVQQIVTGGIIVLAVALDRWRERAGAAWRQAHA